VRAQADVAGLVARFEGTQPVAVAAPCTQGHINTTYFVTTRDGGRFVLQRINAHVFPDPRNVVANVAAVSRHVAPQRLVPRLLQASTGEPWVEDDAGGVWRLCEHVDGRSASFLTDLAMAREAGAAFGRLQRALADFDGTELVPAIPHFHDLEWRFSRLDAVLAGAHRADRRPVVADELAFFDARRALAAAVRATGLHGVIHGDCKVNNLIFDLGSNVVRAVVDLDTVMVGSRAWDFGDLVRSAATTGAEDDPRAEISVEMFTAIATGFVQSLGDLLDNASRAELVTACRYITLMLALRFLIDYLEGDVYFRAARPTHNLERARAQLAVVKSLERRERDLLAAIRKV
jgi:N-acetylhexosamine 1-kinase